MLFNENDERGGNEQFVGNRVEQSSHFGNLIAPACKVSVQNIGKRRGEKNGDGERVAAHAEPIFGKRREQNDHKKRNDDDS